MEVRCGQEGEDNLERFIWSLEGKGGKKEEGEQMVAFVFLRPFL